MIVRIESMVSKKNSVCLSPCGLLLPQAALSEVQEQLQKLQEESEALKQQEHALQKESLSVRLRIEQIDASVTEYSGKIKHWQKEVRGPQQSRAEQSRGAGRSRRYNNSTNSHRCLDV